MSSNAIDTFSQLIYDKCSQIEKSLNIETLKALESEMKEDLGQQFFINEKKYPRLKFRISKNEIEKLKKENLEFKNLVNKQDLITLEKLMLSILWKNGDFGKEKHIIEGIINTNFENKTKGIVFYQFGKKINSPNSEPIIDQHILRAFKFYQCIRNKEDFKTLNTISKKHKVLITEYKSWLANILKRQKNNDHEDFLYYIDKILFGLGKYIKKTYNTSINN